MGVCRKSQLLTTLSEAANGCCLLVLTPAASSSIPSREGVLEVAYRSGSNRHSYLFKDPDADGQWVEGVSSPLTLEDLKLAQSTILLHKAEVMLQVYARYVEELFLSHLRKPTTEVVVCTQHGCERAVEETLTGLGKQKGQWSLTFQDVPPAGPGSWLHTKTLPGKYTGLWKDDGRILEVSDLSGPNVPDKVAVSGLYPLSKLLERHGSGTPNLELELLQKLCEAGIRSTLLMSSVKDVKIERLSITNRLRAMGVTSVDATSHAARASVGALVPIQVNTMAGEILVFEVDSQRDTIADLKRQIYSRVSDACFRLTAADGALMPTNTEWVRTYVDGGLTLVKVSFLARLLSPEVKWDKCPGRYAYYNIQGDVQGATALLSACDSYGEDAALLEMAAVSADSDSLRHIVDVHLHRGALQVLGCLDAVLLLPPLLLLTSALPHASARGLELRWLAQLCLATVACLWLSLAISAAQLLALGSAGQRERPALAARLQRHLLFPALSTLLGGLCSAAALWGYSALALGGEEELTAQGLLGALLLLSLLLPLPYSSALACPRLCARGARRAPTLPEPEAATEEYEPGGEGGTEAWTGLLPELEPAPRRPAIERLEGWPPGRQQCCPNCVPVNAVNSVWAGPRGTIRSVSPQHGVSSEPEGLVYRKPRPHKRASAPPTFFTQRQDRSPLCPKNTLRPTSPAELQVKDNFEEAFARRSSRLSATSLDGLLQDLLEDKKDDLSLSTSNSEAMPSPTTAPILTPAVAGTCSVVLSPVEEENVFTLPLPHSGRISSISERMSHQSSGRSERSVCDVYQPAVYMYSDPINYDKLLERLRDKEPGEEDEEGMERSPEEEEQREQRPLSEDKLLEEEESKSGSDESEGEGGEIWSCGQVEVPIWLLDRLKASGWMPNHEQPAGSSGGPAGGEAAGSSDESARPTALSGVEGPEVQPPEAAAGKAERRSSNTFWKIPLPTRRNSVHVSELENLNETDADIDEALDQNRAKLRLQASNRLPPGRRRKTLAPTLPGVAESAPLLEVPGRRESTTEAVRLCRPRKSFSSALGMINDDATTPGLYAVPAEESGATGSIIEIRRRSLAMSTSVLMNTLQSKVGVERIDELDTLELGGDDEVVLPLFRPEHSYRPRKCMCQADPETGLIIHTCMTPASTQCENTQAVGSYVCSSWASRGNSRPGSPGRRKSAGKVASKRIRHASMLEMLGSGRPAVNGKGPKAEVAPGKKIGLQAEALIEDDETNEENELAVSFCSIQRSKPVSRQGSSERQLGEASPPAGGSASSLSPPTGTGPPGLEPARGGSPEGGPPEDPVGPVRFLSPNQFVEHEIGHRFELVEPLRLAAMLQDEGSREQLLVIDVRGRDWVGGHIPLSINLRTTEVVAQPGKLLGHCRRNRIQQIVFTCMYSVLRARKCAMALETQQEEEHRSGHCSYRVRIALLAGGVHAWVNCFADKQSLTVPPGYADSFEGSMWCDGGPSQGGLVHAMDALWSSGGQKALSDALAQELQSLEIKRSGDGELSS